jgi:hypothetical protein
MHIQPETKQKTNHTDKKEINDSISNQILNIELRADLHDVQDEESDGSVAEARLVVDEAEEQSEEQCKQHVQVGD